MKHPKLLKAFVIFVFIMIIAIIVLNKIANNEMPIYERFGNYLPMSISLKDSLYVKTYSITNYLNLIEKHDYEKAYSMLTTEYKKLKPYEEYVRDIENFEYENIVVKSIKQLSEYTYTIELENTNTKETNIYTAYMDEFNKKVFTISPDKFIYYDDPDVAVESNGISAKLKEYMVMQDSVELSLTIKNNTQNDQIIEDIKLNLANRGVLAHQFEKMTIKAGEEKNLNVLYSETDYYIPTSVVIETDKTTLMIDLKK